ncbi:MAG: type IV pili twitching motility protein PilT [Zetaproteobacteria bacterium]|nr:type IV pili twitching motility protein PilT [Pseudobdellovibrionaceae bacterium]|tara:strand:+ start:66 stop:1136 length:1071 start_codon:yes stop_codon:yes gene_type:complete
MKLDQILKVAARGQASDILLKADAYPRFRFQGELVDLADGAVITHEMMKLWVGQIVPPHLHPQLRLLKDLDFSYQMANGSRFRVNLFRQQGKWGLVLRVLHNRIKTMDELQLPEILHSLPKRRRGLVLVTGATGSGKSTTLSAMIEKINSSFNSHIITIEDPVEVIFKEKKSTINQREIGTDTGSFSDALRSALRQNPDVILVGELRDRETTETALMAAETGHLVMSTLHTNDAVESLTRLLSYFPPREHPALRMMLSMSLEAVVSQRLVRRADHGSQVAAMEIMLANAHIKEIIMKGEDFSVIKDAISNGHESYGMQTFDQSLLSLYQRDLITKEEAMKQASKKEDLKLAMSGVA